MNVCLISREYPPFFGGGIGTYTARFARALADAGHRALVVTVSRDGREHREQDAGVTVVRLPFLDGDDWSAPHPAIRSPRTLAAFRTFHPVSVFAMQVADALPRLAAEFAIDVVEAPECGALAWFALNGRRCGRHWAPPGRPVPMVTYLHSPTEWIEQWNGGPEAGHPMAELRHMETDTIRWSDALVCPSAALADWARQRWQLPPDAIDVVPQALGPLEPIARRAASDPPPPRRPGACRLFYAGRLEPRKGVDTLLAGFAAAVAQGADLELTLAGRDTTDVRTGRPFGQALLEQLPAPARPRVRVLGERPAAELARWRTEADAVVVPSPMDNYPCTLVEAMADGRPVITTRAGGMGELVRDGQDGLLFEPGDANSCAAVLLKVAADPKAVLPLGPAAARRALDVCGNAAVIGRRIEHFERAIESRRSRGQERRTSQSLVVINRHGAPSPAIGSLADALHAALAQTRDGEPGPAFAHGWTRAGRHGDAEGTVVASGTPTLDSLTSHPRHLGPLVVRADALDEPRVRAHVRFEDREDGNSGELPEATTADTWLLATLLCERGRSGLVVPDVLIDRGDAGTDTDLPAVVARLARRAASAEHGPRPNGGGWRRRAEAAEAELAAIHASRGWRALQRIYRILHVLRGRAGGRKGPRPSRL